MATLSEETERGEEATRFGRARTDTHTNPATRENEHEHSTGSCLRGAACTVSASAELGSGRSVGSLQAGEAELAGKLGMQGRF